jgi:predicted nucleic acid-binding protein
VNAQEGFLLDTNVVSELRKLRRDERVMQFLLRHQQTRTYISVLTVGELWKGAAKKRRIHESASESLENWILETEQAFSGRVLSIDRETARLWGEWSSGRTRPVIDTLLAATAARHGLTLVTRNTADVADLPVRVVNPWTDES